jgi:hypothetical protein
MVAAGAWIPADHLPNLIVSPAFVVANRSSGKRRVVIDMRALNAQLVVPAFRYDTIQLYRRLVAPGAQQISWDLSDGYLAIAVHPRHQAFTAFSFGGRLYRCAALPFGLAISPFVFSKTMRVLIRHWRGAGIDAMSYLDDFAVALEPASAAAVAERLVADVEASGLVIHPTKRQLTPVRAIPLLGFVVDAGKHTLALPERRQAQIRSMARGALVAIARHGAVPMSLLRSLLGVVAAAHPALWEARLRSRRLYNDLAAAGRRPRVRISPGARTDLRFFSRITDQVCRRPLQLREQMPQLFTDASDSGWGAAVAAPGSALPAALRASLPPQLVGQGTRAGAAAADQLQQALQAQAALSLTETPAGKAEPAVLASLAPAPVHAVARGFWSAEDATADIFVRELRAVELALQLWARRLAPAVLLNVDNAAAVYALAGMTSRNPTAWAVLRRISLLCRQTGLVFAVRWLPSEANVVADLLSRLRDPDDYQLAPALYEQACRCAWRRAVADIDLFATQANQQETALGFCSLLPQPGALPADAFALSWRPPTRLWANPPWGLLHRVLQKAAADGADMLLCSPLWPSAPWFPLALRLASSWIDLPPAPGTFIPPARRAPAPLPAPPWSVRIWRLPGRQ